ncbi:GNAT family N-acetyltransferase [Winogradskyella luteola]|uniref:GNAT family N-acetyltransferase n=1 Tax=Winogradskyella luteola TaxID=2828330 RepID=A0A9X1JNW3_9FLAO|nr:GNAT family N-acetyltransferase [Winogradskyella luteola]MBV7269816.1 GNAT family N-acetyltransferase [Winogradskyella luteola]
MDYQFKILPNNNLEIIIPLVFELNEGKVSQTVLKSRFDEMQHQNYECVVIFYRDEVIGVTGLWFCTRHYAGKSVELDHVYIKPKHRNKGLGKQFMDWIYTYVKEKDCNSMELNTYVQNYPSHKFYHNEGYEILGYHFYRNI